MEFSHAVPGSPAPALFGRTRARSDRRPAHALRILAACAALLGLDWGIGVRPARAVDGVLEINQVCAANKGCFAGDSAGFPVTITQNGSYRLTGNLTVPSADTDGIALEQGLIDVTIDLNGFAIIGPVQCGYFAPASCPAAGSGFGVRVLDGESNVTGGLTLINGTISGMGSAAVYVSGSRADVRDLRVRGNAGGGLAVYGGKIERVLVEFNGSYGIVASSDVSITDSSVQANAGPGISGGGLIARNQVYSNGGDGILATANGPNVYGNQVVRNTLDGIRVGGQARVSGNSVFWNGTDQIDAGTRASVDDNMVTRQSSGYGLRLGTGAAYRNNTISSSGSSDSVTGGVDAGGNVCNGGVCP